MYMHIYTIHICMYLSMQLFGLTFLALVSYLADGWTPPTSQPTPKESQSQEDNGIQVQGVH